MAPRDPSSCRGWIAFRVGPHFSRPSARRGLRRQERDALSGAYLSPQCCNAVRSSEGATAQGHGGMCPPLRCYRARGRMGARVMASGMPGASRRAVLGGATYSVVKVWVRLRGAGRPWQRHNQRHISGARPARGGQSWTLCPRVRRHVPLACIGLAGWGMAEARARGEYSTGVLGCVKEMHRPRFPT